MTTVSGVVILGAGGLAREVLWALRHPYTGYADTREVLGYIDENEANWGKQLCGIPVLGGFQWFQTVDTRQLKVICAVGSPRARRSLVRKAMHLGLTFCSIVYSSVQMSDYVDIGLGTTITAGCILTANIRVGNHAFLNLDTTVGHDVVIEDFVNLAPGCHISGNVNLKEGADLGTGAVVLQGITVGRWATVGAGAVVIHDLPDNAVAVGVPARVTKYTEPC